MLPLFLSACPPTGGNGGKVGLSITTKSLFGNIPDGDYQLVGFLDFTKFVDSEFGRKIIEFSPTALIWDEKLGLGYDEAKMAVFVARFGEDLSTEGEVLMVVAGDLSEDDIISRLDTKAEYFQKEELEGVNFYTLQEFSFAVPTEGLIAFGSPELVRSAIKLSKGKGKALGKKGVLSKFKEDMRQDDSFWVGIDQIDKILVPLSSRETLLKGFTTLQSGFLAISFDEDAKFRGLVSCEDEESAAKIASSLGTLVGMLSFLIKQAEFEDLPAEVDADRLRGYLVSMLDSIDIRSEGKNILVNFTAASDIVDYLAEVTKVIVTDSDDQ